MVTNYSIVWRAFVRDWSHFRLHWLTTIAGIGIAVAIVSAVHIAIDKTQAAIERNQANLYGDATHTIEPVSGWLPENLYRRAVIDYRIETLEPVIQAWVTLDKTGTKYLLLGVDPLRISNRSRGNEPQAVDASALTRLLTEPGAVVVGSALLTQLALTVNSSIEIHYDERRAQARIVSVTTPSFVIDNPIFERIIVADIATAQELLGIQGYVSYLKVRDASSGDLKKPSHERLLKFVADHHTELVLVSQEKRFEEASSLPNAFYANIKIIGWLSLLLGMMIALNATLYVVRLRKDMVGTLRAIGVTSNEVLLLQGGSFLITAAIGSALGLALGVLVSDMLYVLTLRTVNELFHPTLWVNEGLSLITLIKALAVGFGAGVLGAFVSAWQARAITPVTLMREKMGAPRSPVWRWALGVLLILLSLLSLSQDGSAFFGVHAALFGLLGGYVLLCPEVIVSAASGLAALAANFVNPLTLWGLRNIRRLKKFYALAMASLVVAVSIAMALQIMVGSFRAAVDVWISQGFDADYYVSLSNPLPGQGFSTLDRARLAQVPGVKSVVASSRIVLSYEGADVTVFAQEDFDQVPHRFPVIEIDAAMMAKEDSALVTEAFSFYHHVGVGDPVLLTLGSAQRELRISGIVRDYSSGKGSIITALSAIRPLMAEPPTTTLAVYVNADAYQGNRNSLSVELLQKALPRESGVRIRDSHFIRTFTLDVFDRTFEIITVLSFVVIATSCLGVMIALFTAQTEKKQDYRVLRMLGVTQKEIGGLIYREVSIISVISSLVAIPLAYMLAYFFCHRLMKQSFGWSFPLQVEGSGVGIVFLIAVAGSLLAGVLVARHFSSPQRGKGQHDVVA